MFSYLSEECREHELLQEWLFCYRGITHVTGGRMNCKVSGIINEIILVAFADSRGNMIGRLDIENGRMVFSGNMDESAKVFFELLKKVIDEYIKHDGVYEERDALQDEAANLNRALEKACGEMVIEFGGNVEGWMEYFKEEEE